MQKLTKFCVAAISWLLLSLTIAGAQDAGSKRISVTMDGTVKEVLDVLCTEIDGSLLVRSTDVDLSRKVSINMKNATVNEVLALLFKDSDIKWTISGKQIQIYRPKAPKPESPAGHRTVSGTITDENGEPVIGAAVMLEGTKIAATTDANGIWALSIPEETKSL
ncbi:MAG: carboxypeptidase-like regulatory domain-containing protein [Bacteroidales bacterium]|nr:carboxypeptidase-like regulatory domain-containing protein [Bacteroidales bacterium]